MFERISRGIALTGQSWQVLRQEKSLLVFPLLSGIASMLVLASFVVPLWFTGYAEVVLNERQAPQDPVAYAVLFAFYFVNYFVIVFFNAALMSCAMIRFHGGDPTVSDGLHAASSRLPQIAAWACLAATVGVILKVIEGRSEKIGQIAAGLLGAAWTIATYFVVPVLVVEKVGPIDAVKRSLSILKRTWGESLTANFGIGLAVMLACLLAAIPMVLGIVSGSMTAAVVGIVISVVCLILISLISAALHSIIIAALYLYASEGKAPAQFDEQLLRDAYAPKSGRGTQF